MAELGDVPPSPGYRVPVVFSLGTGVHVPRPAAQREITRVVTLFTVRHGTPILKFPSYLMGRSILPPLVNAISIPKRAIARLIRMLGNKTGTSPRPAAITIGSVDLSPEAISARGVAVNRRTLTAAIPPGLVRAISDKGDATTGTVASSIGGHRLLPQAVSWGGPSEHGSALLCGTIIP